MKLILLIIAVIILVPLASSETWSDDTDVTEILWNQSVIGLQCDINVTQDNGTYAFVGEEVDTVTHDTSNVQVGAGSCSFPAADAAINFPQLATGFDTLYNFTYAFWIKAVNKPGDMRMFGRQPNSDFNSGHWRAMISDNEAKFDFLANGEMRITDATDFTNNAWHFIAIVINQTGTSTSMQEYHDGLPTNVAVGASSLNLATNAMLTIGRIELSPTIDFVGNLDEIWLFNYSAKANHIKHLFDLGVNGTPLFNTIIIIPPDITPPVITIVSPTNNTRVNDLPLNMTFSVSDDFAGNMDCSLRNETVLFDEISTAQTTNFNLTFNNSVTETEINQKVTFNITCFDVALNFKTELLNITIDTINPAIVITSPLNNSVIDKTFNDLEFNSLCTDISPLAYNISLIDSSGNVLNSSQNNSPILTELQLKGEFGLSSVPSGEYTLNFTCVDSHTYTDAKIVDVYKDELLKKLYYTTKSSNDISIQFVSSNMNLCDFSSYPLFDREVFVYDFSCNKGIGQNYYQFILRDNYGKLKYLPKSKYKAHFVTEDNFITFDLKNAEYSIAKSGKDYAITVWTYDTYLEFKNSIGGLNKELAFLNINVSESNFTSIDHFDIQIDEIILNSDTFVTVSDVSFNLSQDELLTMKNSLILTKFSNPQSTEVTGRLTFNNEVLLERYVSSVAGLDTVRSINFIIINVNGKAGTNNLTYEIKEDGAGSINISNWQTHIVTNITTNNVEYGTTERIINTSFSSSTFTNITSIFVNKNISSNTFLDISNRFEANTASTITCLIDDTISSPIYRRRVLSSTDVASTGISFIDKQESDSKTYHINCSNTEGATIQVNATFIAMDLRDLSGYIINANTSSNPNTGLTGSTVTLSEGNHEITSIGNFPVRNGTKIEVTSTVHLNSSTGDQIIMIILNTSNNCFDSHSRSLTTNDIGTIKFYSSCNITGISFINVTLGIKVSAGETVEIVDESLTIFEIKSLNTSIANTAPLVNLLSPALNSELNGVSTIEWFTSELNGNDFVTNITVINSSDTNEIAINLGDDITNISFNFSTLGAGSFILNITSLENDTAELLFGTATITFRVVPFAIIVNLSSPANNSILESGNIAFQFITQTSGANCSLHIDNTINFANQSQNSTIGLNTFATVNVANGTHDWLVRCVNESLSGVSGQFFFDVLLESANALSIRSCPDTVAEALILIMLVIIALVFIIMGLGAGALGVFGAVMLMITSWYISPCLEIFAFALALLSGFLIIFFIAKSFTTNIN